MEVFYTSHQCISIILLFLLMLFLLTHFFLLEHFLLLQQYEFPNYETSKEYLIYLVKMNRS